MFLEFADSIVLAFGGSQTAVYLSTFIAYEEIKRRLSPQSRFATSLLDLLTPRSSEQDFFVCLFKSTRSQVLNLSFVDYKLSSEHYQMVCGCLINLVLRAICWVRTIEDLWIDDIVYSLMVSNFLVYVAITVALWCKNLESLHQLPTILCLVVTIGYLW